MTGLLALAMGATVAVAGTPDWSRPRSLPSLLVRWRVDGGVAALEAREGTVFALTATGLLAFDGRTGAVLWREPRIAKEWSFGQQSPLLVTDDRLFVLDKGRVWALDRSSGAVLQETALPGDGWSLWGPTPVVQVKTGEDDYALLTLDPSTGRVRGRITAPGWVTALVVQGDVAVAATYQKPDLWVRGLRLPDLTELWRVPGLNTVERFSGRVFAARDAKDETGCCPQDFLEIDPSTGRLGPGLPRRETNDVSAGLPWDLDLLVSADQEWRLRRNDPGTGQVRWIVPLPGDLDGWCRGEGALYLHTGGEGRGFVVAIDWETGSARAAYGLRDVRHLALVDDLLVLGGNEELVAVSANEFGPPEAGLTELQDEVRRILDAPKDEYSLSAPILDLMALGDDALPILSAEASRRDGFELRVIAAVLGAATYRPVAPVLAGRLAGAQTLLIHSLLEALARVAGPTEVPQLAAVLEDPDRDLSVRFEAFQALASLGTPGAEVAVLRALADRSRATKAGSWIPSPAAYLDRIGKPLDKQKQDAAAAREDFAEYHRLSQGARSVRVPLPNGRGLILFADGQLGKSDDLWSAPQQADGRLAGPATFLGVTMPGTFAANLEEGTLEINGLDPPAPPVRVDLDAASHDGDGDGLSDLVERRIGTDPEDADTDGDGVVDGQDPNPDHAPHAPSGEEQEIAGEIFRQYFLFAEESERRELLLVESAFALDWMGRTGKTLTVAPGRANALREAGGHKCRILHLAAAPEVPPGTAPDPLLRRPVTRPPGPDERLYHLGLYRGPLNAESYDVVVRRLGGRWIIRELRMATVS